MKRIYISGPITGMPDLNFPPFNSEAARLRALGYDVVNPVELNPDPNTPWHDCMTVVVTCASSQAEKPYGSSNAR